jgi:hypothetical protein
MQVRQESVAGQFVDGFATAWADPTPDRLAALLDPDIRLVAPLTRTTNGLEAAKAEFARLLALLPDLRGEVHRWSETEQFVLIDFTLAATVGRRTLRWDLIDRFQLRDGRALERISYFDPLPIVTAFLTQPSAWPRLARSTVALLRAPRA